jgi:hypothetical protein
LAFPEAERETGSREVPAGGSEMTLKRSRGSTKPMESPSSSTSSAAAAAAADADAQLIRIDVVLEGALRYMVRLMVGAAVAQLRGRLPVGAIEEALAQPGGTAPDGATIIARPCTGSALWLSDIEVDGEGAALGPPCAHVLADCTIVETLPAD